MHDTAPEARRKATARRGFGAIRRLPSKRYQASYLGPDLRRHVAPTTYAARVDAEGWLATERRLVETDTWTTPETRDPRRSAPTTLAALAAESFGRPTPARASDCPQQGPLR